MHQTELPCTLLSFTASFFELLCTLWATLHPLSYAAPAFYWAITNPTEQHCILFSYDAACWATLFHPTELCCTPLICACIIWSYNTPYWATLHPFYLWCSLLSYPLSPYWAMLYLLNYAAPSEQWCTLLSQGALYWATLHLTELRCTH